MANNTMQQVHLFQQLAAGIAQQQHPRLLTIWQLQTGQRNQDSAPPLLCSLHILSCLLRKLPSVGGLRT
jgi:hypothetical protein